MGCGFPFLKVTCVLLQPGSSCPLLCLLELRIRSPVGTYLAVVGLASLCCYALVLGTENQAVVAGSLRSFAASPLAQSWHHTTLWSLSALPIPVHLCYYSGLPAQSPFSSLCRLALCGRGLPGRLPPLPPPGHLLVPVLSPHLLLLRQMPLLSRQVLLP